MALGCRKVNHGSAMGIETQEKRTGTVARPAAVSFFAAWCPRQESSPSILRPSTKMNMDLPKMIFLHTKSEQ